MSEQREALVAKKTKDGVVSTTDFFVNGVFAKTIETKKGTTFFKTSLSVETLEALVAKAKEEKMKYIDLAYFAKEAPFKNDKGQIIATHDVSLNIWKPDPVAASSAGNETANTLPF
jgi:hypothetical protein